MSVRVAMIGQRGIPATFGGIERHVEELGARLVQRGHRVVVFSRTNYADNGLDRHRGVELRHLPSVSSKHLDAIVHSSLSTLVAMAGGFDIIHYHALGPGIPSLLPRYLASAKVVQTVHGLDGERHKWSRAARSVLKGAEWMSARLPHATIVVSRALAEHYAERWDRQAWCIPNGVNRPVSRPADQIVRRFGLQPGAYLLFVGRLVPEKAPDLLVRSFRRLPDPDIRLVIAGGSSFTDDYVRSLHRLAEDDDRILLTGYVYGEVLDELYSNAAAFVLPSFVEGLPLTLLEAAAHGTPVVTSDIPPHLEVLGSDRPGRRLFPAGDGTALEEVLEKLLANQGEERLGAEALRTDILRAHSWDRAADETLQVYRHVLG